MKKAVRVLFFLFAISFAVRFTALNQSLWLDEATTAKVVHDFSFLQIITQFSPGDFHPPFYYLLMRVWVLFFGYSETALRMPSVIFSLAAGWFVYLSGKKLKNGQAGWWAAAFFLLNPLVVYYSQEARMYMMAVFFMAGALNYFIDMCKNSGPPLRSVILTNAFIFLSFLTFYGSVFFIASLYLYLVFKRQWRNLALLLPGFLLALSLLTPLLLKQFANSREAMKLVVNWGQVLGKASIKNLLLIFIKLSTGRISWDPKVAYYALAVPWSAMVWFSALKSYKKQGLLVMALLVPLALGLVFSVFSPLLQYFRFIYLIIPLTLLLGLSLQNKAAKGLILTGFALFSLAYLFFPQFHREDWKSLSMKLPLKQVYMVPDSADPVRYYRPDISIRSLLDPGKISGPAIAVIPYTADIYGLNYSSELDKAGYFKKDTLTVRGLSAETWQKK